MPRQPLTYAPRTFDTAPAPEDALAQFLSGNDGESAQGIGKNPALELAALRDSRQGELQDRIARDVGAGDKRDAGEAKTWLDMLSADIAKDPSTGDAAHAQVKQSEDAIHSASLANQEPMLGQQQHAEKFALKKANIEHPNPNVSPFAGGGSGGPGPGGFGGSTGGTTHGVSAPKGVDPGAWAQHTSDLTPEAASKLSALVNYELPIPSGNVLSRPEWSTLMGRAKLVDPGFDAKNYSTRQAYMTDFAKGKTGNAVQGLDTVMKHLDTFSGAADSLKNSGNHSYNAAANFFQGLGSFPEKKSFEDAANAVSGELSNVFKQSGATDHEIATWRNELSSSNTPDEFKAKLKTLTDLIHGRMDAVNKHYSDVMGRKAPNFLSDESQGIWDRFQHQGQPSGGAAPSGVTVRRIG